MRRTPAAIAIILARAVAVGLLAASCITPPAAPTSESTEPTPEEKRCELPPSIGKLAEVQLWTASLASRRDLGPKEEVAEGGITMDFLITSDQAGNAAFRIADRIETTVNGVPYDLRNRRRYNRVFATKTTVFQPAEYNAAYDPDVTVPDGKAGAVLMVLVPGVPVDPSTAVKVEIDAGWGDKVERHRFAFLPKCIHE